MRAPVCLVAAAILFTACRDAPTYALSADAPLPVLRVRPGGTGQPVELTVTNTGTATWRPGEVKLVFREAPGWSGGALELAQAARPGAAATFKGALDAPEQVGRYVTGWLPQRGGTSFGPALEVETEVTCSDGLFCNGEERYAGGRCVPSPAPCDDDAACTEDHCDETTRTCQHTLTGSCAVCQADCAPACDGKQCGDDGCGGSCGRCPAGTGCAQGLSQCKPETQPGTCNNPLPLLPQGVPLPGDHVVTGDSSGGLHQVTPSCNRASTSVEIVYTFTTPQRMGLDARVSGYDTVLHLRRQRGTSGTADCLDDTPGRTLACSDDTSPPGNYGSRIALALEPGTYYLIVDGFDSTQRGPFTLQLRFTADGCVPRCDGLYCGGDDGCGGDCGSCDTGHACVKGRCLPSPCTPDCNGRQCGDDGCGGTCGTCQDGALCVPATHTCQTFAPCDHLHPTCDPPCAATEFCGSDCACHPVVSPLPDLIVDTARLQNEIVFDTIDVTEHSCAMVEGCVEAPGRRRLLRFSVEAVNQGNATLEVPPPAERPDLFVFSPCHGHYHFSGFATYALLDRQGRTVLTGRKQAYCMEDTERVVSGPSVPCSKRYTCDEQGIQRGWGDLYGNMLDCQWLDITDLRPGQYQLQVNLNPNRAFQEVTLDNNTAVVPVSIPPP